MSEGGSSSGFIQGLRNWLLVALFLALGAPCKVPSLPQWTEESVSEKAGEQAVVLLNWATRGRTKHTLGGACQPLLLETAPRGLKRLWVLEAPGP